MSSNMISNSDITNYQKHTIIWGYRDYLTPMQITITWKPIYSHILQTSNQVKWLIKTRVLFVTELKWEKIFRLCGYSFLNYIKLDKFAIESHSHKFYLIHQVKKNHSKPKYFSFTMAPKQKLTTFLMII
jgi:hypothetical protein